MEKVRIYIEISGDYCAFHEMGFSVVYDVTNNKKLGDVSLKKLKSHEYCEYVDYKEVDALKIDGKYYVDFDNI